MTAPTVAGRAARAATQVNRAQISVRAGLFAAIPVAGVLALGMAVGQPVAAVTMGAGAMLSGVAWRGANGPVTPPTGTMIAAAAGLAIATLAGSLSGSWPWVHLLLLMVFALAAGLLSSLGRRGNVVGIQAVIAFVVFGRFPENLPGAITLAALVLAGGAAQILFASLVARPPTWRQQRTAVADAYRSLAELAGRPGSPSVAAATALDDAERILTGPALFADPAAMTLASLVEEGRRIRLELIALAPTAQRSEIAERLEQARRILALVASSIENRGRSDPALASEAEGLGAWIAAPEDPAQGGVSIEQARIAALGGQLRAVVRLTTQSSRPAGLRHLAHPTRGTRLPFAQLPSDVRRLRASATLGSATGRHAVRLALVAGGTELLVQQAGLPRGYWTVIAAVTVLRPEFGATITRGAERLLGTLLGVVAATLIAVALAPGTWTIVAIVGVLAWATYTVFPASFAWGTAGLTAVVVFLLHPVAPSTAAIALDRGIDTAIGGVIGLAVYLLWPTWSGKSVGGLLADVVDAQRDYLDPLLEWIVTGAAVDEAKIRPRARRSRIAYSDAEAAVTLSRAEPRRGADPGLASSTLVGLRRVVYAIHALRVDAGLPDRRPLPQVRRLRDALDEAFVRLSDSLRAGAGSKPDLPPLRGLYREAMVDLPFAENAPILAPLDELIDALNTVAAGLKAPTP